MMGTNLARAVRRMNPPQKQVDLIDCETIPEWFHDSQKEAARSEAELVAVIAGWQAGKTVVGPWWLRREISRTTATDYAAISPTYPLLIKKVLPELKAIFKGLATYKAADRCFVFSEEGARALGRTGPITIWLGYAAQPDSLESATYGAVWFDEPGQAPEESHHVLRARVAVMGGRLLYTSRPYTFNWYKHLIWDKRDEKTIHCVNFKSIDNPSFPKKAYEQAKKEMPAWKHAMKYDGLFTKPAGAVYDCFDSAVHVKKLLNTENCPVFLGLDFGPVNTAGVFVRELPDRRLYVFATYKSGGKTVNEHAVRLVKKAGGPEKLKGCVGGSRSEDEWRNKFGNEGFPVGLPKYRSVDAGIASVYREMKLGRLIIDPALKELIKEIEDYVYLLDQNEEPTDTISEKSTYHRLDALRYVVSTLRPNEAEEEDSAQAHKKAS